MGHFCRICGCERANEEFFEDLLSDYGDTSELLWDAIKASKQSCLFNPERQAGQQ